MSTNELTTKLRELKGLQVLIEEAQAEAETLKDEIKGAVGAQEELRAGEYKVTWRAVNSARLDASALKKAMPDIYESFTRQTSTRRFCVV